MSVSRRLTCSALDRRRAPVPLITPYAAHRTPSPASRAFGAPSTGARPFVGCANARRSPCQGEVLRRDHRGLSGVRVADSGCLPEDRVYPLPESLRDRVGASCRYSAAAGSLVGWVIFTRGFE